MQPGYSTTALWSNSDTLQHQQHQQIFYCYPNNSFAAPSISPVDSGTVLINDPSQLGYFLQPSAAAAGGLLPNSSRYSLIAAPTLPFQQYALGSTQTQQQPVAIPTDQVFITGTKVTRTFDEVLSNPQVCSSRMMMTSHDTDINAEPSNAANDAKKAKLEPDVTCCKPSRVIHFRGIPNDASEGEIVQLGIPFGHMTNMVVAKKKNQALLEMNDVSSAQALVSFYSERPPQIRGRTVYVQFSNHDQLKTEDSLQTACAQAALETAQTMVTNGESQKSVLRVIIENLLYPVTLDMLKQIFAKYGQVVKIVTFNKNNAFQALIQYSDPVSAQMAKMSLDGHSIYPGCCVLRIDFSKLPSLNVRYNNDKSRDFLDSTLPSGDLPITFNAGALAYNPTSGGVLAPTYATAAVIPGIGPTIAYCTTSPTTGALSYGTHGLLPASFQVPAGMRLQWHQQQISPLNAVLLVTNLCEEKVTPDALFILFGVYGDVIRVKIMFNKKDNALVQFSDGNQAQLALMHLDNVKLWGREIKVAPSKHNIVQMPKEGQPDSGLTKDFTNSPLHRFKKPHSKNYNNIYPPSSTLHLSNIPPITTKEFMLDLFSQYGTIVAFKFFETDHKMALMQMSSKEEAMEALIELHNHQLAETTHLRVSFSKSTISPSQDMTENQETIEG